MSNANLNAAKSARNDEFYTKTEDIGNEIMHYEDQFHGKAVYCNCDDPEHSNFWKFFKDNFGRLKLRKLTATGFSLSDDSRMHSVGAEYDGESVTPLDPWNADFLSHESICTLNESDIVVTNPPFSPFREYIDMLLDSGRKFCVMGNMNAMSYSNILKGMQEGKIWCGATYDGMDFDTPEESTGVVPIRWFTNMDHERRHDPIELACSYDPSIHPAYDNFEGIEVSKVKEIPKDWDGVMGVPITYLDRHCPEQFEILGTADGDRDNPFRTRFYTADDTPRHSSLNARACVRRGDGDWDKKYARILIRRIS